MARASRRRIFGIGALFLTAFGLDQGCAQRLVLPERPLHRADAVVVLGNRPPTDEHGRVMEETRRRVERGAEVLLAGWADEIVFTGGPAPFGQVEARVMADLAESLGVPRSVMRLEEQSTNTIENARFSAELLCKGAPICQPSIILVSSPYHLRRAKRLFECAGFRVQTAASEDPGGAYAHRFARSERFVHLYYTLIDECARARRADR